MRNGWWSNCFTRHCIVRLKTSFLLREMPNNWPSFNNKKKSLNGLLKDILFKILSYLLDFRTLFSVFHGTFRIGQFCLKCRVPNRPFWVLPWACKIRFNSRNILICSRTCSSIAWFWVSSWSIHALQCQCTGTILLAKMYLRRLLIDNLYNSHFAPLAISFYFILLLMRIASLHPFATLSDLNWWW